MANENITQPLTLPKNVTAPFYWSESVFRQALGQDMSKIILGGGTVLAMHWKHRVSTYLDYFLNEPNLAKASEIINKTHPSNLEEIAEELKKWRSSDLVKTAMDGKDLIEPYYQAIADNLWSHAETAIRTRTLPEHLFVTEIQTPGLVR